MRPGRVWPVRIGPGQACSSRLSIVWSDISTFCSMIYTSNFNIFLDIALFESPIRLWEKNSRLRAHPLHYAPLTNKSQISRTILFCLTIPLCFKPFSCFPSIFFYSTLIQSYKLKILLLSHSIILFYYSLTIPLTTVLPQCKELEVYQMLREKITAQKHLAHG